MDDVLREKPAMKDGKYYNRCAHETTKKPSLLQNTSQTISPPAVPAALSPKSVK
jgi:hypothetical protein